MDMWRTMIWQQFGAAIDMLENAIDACPEDLWGDRTRRPEFWYTAYHTVFFLDLYLSDSVESYVPPAPFNLDELQPNVPPPRVYSKTELTDYLAHARSRCRSTIEALKDENASKRCGFKPVDVSVAELLLYNLRHVQHHAGQLNLILRQTIGSAPGWVVKHTD